MQRHPRAKKSLGQNFLVDERFVARIISAVTPAAGETIVEIGPGTGALTERLLRSEAAVVAIELDRDMAPELRERFKSYRNFSVIEADALTVNYRNLLPTDGSHLRLVANLPYNISTAILQRLIEFRGCFSDLTLMFQLEVVERIIAPPGSSNRGFLTVTVEIFFDSQKLFDVPPSAFRPVPKITSAVVGLVPAETTVDDTDAFRNLVSTAFAHKRKTLLNNLKSEYQNAAAVLNQADIVDTNRRAESLKKGEWLALYGAVAKYREMR